MCKIEALQVEFIQALFSPRTHSIVLDDSLEEIHMSGSRAHPKVFEGDVRISSEPFSEGRKLPKRFGKPRNQAGK